MDTKCLHRELDLFFWCQIIPFKFQRRSARLYYFIICDLRIIFMLSITSGDAIFQLGNDCLYIAGVVFRFPSHFVFRSHLNLLTIVINLRIKNNGTLSCDHHAEAVDALVDTTSVPWYHLLIRFAHCLHHCDSHDNHWPFIFTFLAYHPHRH